MPRFLERFYSLNLYKSAEFGASREVYTLACRLIEYGREKESKNLILTPGGGELKNETQWNSFKNLTAQHALLIFSLSNLKPFFNFADFDSFISSKRPQTLQLKDAAALMFADQEHTTIEELNARLSEIDGHEVEEKRISPEAVLERLGKILSGLDPGLRDTVARLVRFYSVPLADWIEGFRSRKRPLPPKLTEVFKPHFLDYKSDIPELPENVSAIFSKDGILSSVIDDFEHRPEQGHFASLYERTIRNDEFFVAEAGTGTGKSLAYLIPSILQIARQGRRVVVSTYTRTLQNQLFFNDLPLAARASGRDFKAALLKGRGNYLCLLKSAMLRGNVQSQLKPDEIYDLARLLIWESLTSSGDLAELNLNSSNLRREVSAEANFCLGPSCQFYKDCYFFKARKNSSKADLNVVNQALFFSDMMAESKIMGRISLAVFDEAHRLEKTATSHLGGELERFYPLSVLNSLYIKRDEQSSLINLVEQLYIHMLALDEEPDSDLYQNARKCVEDCRSDLNGLFDMVKEIQISRNFQPETFAIKHGFKKESEIFALLSTPLTKLHNSLAVLDSALNRIASEFTGIDLDQNSLIRVEQLNRSAAEIKMLKMNTSIFAECDSTENVFWLEFNPRGHTMLAFAPIRVGEKLKELIYEDYDSILFTSASLSVEGYFDFFAKSIGLDLLEPERVVKKSFGSSYDFFSQVAFYCPVFLPSPKTEYYTGALAKFIRNTVPPLKKKTMILCTSNQMVAELYNQTSRNLRSHGFRVLAQSISGTAEQVLHKFRQAPRAVLIGTDSFWEGVDLPGKLLELLIITRLPFAAPTDPVEAARIELIDKAGGNWFAGYSIPHAVLKFKQGFGRLIRQRTDEGIIIVTDNRLVKSNYGQIFLNSVPAQLNIIYDQKELLERMSSKMV